MASLAKRFQTKSEFRKQHDAAYQAANSLGLIEKICAHMVQGRKPKGYWSTEQGRKDIRSHSKVCSTRREFEQRFPAHYNAALRLNFMDEACAHMTTVQRKSGYWKSAEGLREIKAKAAQCRTKFEFRRKYPNEENAARKYYILDDICPHLENVAYPRGFWETPAGLEQMKWCAAQCETRDEFRRDFRELITRPRKRVS